MLRTLKLDTKGHAKLTENPYQTYKMKRFNHINIYKITGLVEGNDYLVKKDFLYLAYIFSTFY